MREERNELLSSFEEIGSAEPTVKDLVMALLIIAIVFAFLVPKIYISNQIYYKSRNINKLLDNYEILKEEHRILKRKIEYAQFKNQILGTIF